MCNKKKILFVMNTLGRAGAEHALVELIKTLELQKYKIYLYVLLPRGEMFNQIPHYVKILNRKTDNRSILSLGGKIFIVGQLLKSLLSGRCLIKTIQRIYELRKKNESNNRKANIQIILRRILADGAPFLKDHFDLAVAYLEGPATWYVAEKVNASCKAAFIHIDYEKAGYTRGLDQECYSEFKRIFAVSNEVKEKFLSVYPEYIDRTFLFCNIINKEKIRNRALLTGGFKDNYKGFRILTVGRLYYQKGYDFAVETADYLVKKGYDFRWYVLGEGEERKNIQTLIKNKKLEDRFILLGAVENPYPYFKQSDLYVCTSRFEGKSIVIEEAQVLGKIVISFVCTGISEQITSGVDGIIVKQDPQTLAFQIGKIIEDPSAYRILGERAYKKEFYDSVGMGKFMQLLQE